MYCPFSLQGYNIASLTSIHIYCYPLQFQPPNCRLNNLSRETNVITSVIPPSSPPYVLVTQCVRLFVTPWTVACQAPLSMGLSRQEYWSGFPCPPLGDLPHPGIELVSVMSPAMAGRFFTTDATWEAHSHHHSHILILFCRFSYIFKMSTV